ncbi:MAG: hypothetical protein IJY27_02070 [Clostridia bacterium]|nr:hypothetical protein [Clostridia bacterium]
MNAYYNDFVATNAAPAVRTKSAPRRRTSLSALIERLLCMIDALLALLSSTKARRVALVASTTACFFVMLGVIGGIEHGLIGWGWGFAIAMVIAIIEGVCIKKCK